MSATMSKPQGIAGLLGDKATSDFTIICRGLRFAVPKLILKARSDYFQSICSNANFTEYHTKELNLTTEDSSKQISYGSLEDDDPFLVFAFLTALYSNDVPSYDEALDRVQTLLPSPDPGIVFGPQQKTVDRTKYHTRLSELADRFLVKGLDDVIARSLFECKRATIVGKHPQTFSYFMKMGSMRAAISTIFMNAARSESPAVAQIIASFVLDYYHHFDADHLKQTLARTPGHSDAICWQQLSGRARLMCPKFGDVVTIKPRDLKGGHARELDGGDQSMYNLVTHQYTEQSRMCSACQHVNSTMEWIKIYLHA